MLVPQDVRRALGKADALDRAAACWRPGNRLVIGERCQALGPLAFEMMQKVAKRPGSRAKRRIRSKMVCQEVQSTVNARVQAFIQVLVVGRSFS